MTTETFGKATDPETNRNYIYQKLDELDKNHSSDDTTIANQGGMYEIPGGSFSKELKSSKMNKQQVVLLFVT